MALDYDPFSRYMEQGARIFYEQLNVPAGGQLLARGLRLGSGCAMGRADGVNVTGVDIAPNLVQRARARANAEALKARFIEGDAEALPFEDAGFDVVISLVGVMFAPRPELVVRELLRVCSPEAQSPWETGRTKDTLDKCSKPSPGSLLLPACQSRCCGATRPWGARGWATEFPTLQ